MSANFNLRNIPTEVMLALKCKAKSQNTSVNILILKLIEKGLGVSYEIKKTTYHDLDKLAGTWTVKDTKDFEKNIKDFEKIDKELW
jgi:hypothetical protein